MTATVSDEDRAKAKRLYHELTSVRGLLMEKRIYLSGKDEAIEVLAEALADERGRLEGEMCEYCLDMRARDTGDNR